MIELVSDLIKCFASIEQGKNAYMVYPVELLDLPIPTLYAHQAKLFPGGKKHNTMRPT